METQWYDNHENITRLLQYLANRGEDADELVRAHEKPWNYEDEYRRAVIGSTDTMGTHE